MTMNARIAGTPNNQLIRRRSASWPRSKLLGLQSQSFRMQSRQGDRLALCSQSRARPDSKCQTSSQKSNRTRSNGFECHQSRPRDLTQKSRRWRLFHACQFAKLIGFAFRWLAFFTSGAPDACAPRQSGARQRGVIPEQASAAVPAASCAKRSCRAPPGLIAGILAPVGHNLAKFPKPYRASATGLLSRVWFDH